jgi:RNA polymerase-binding transcription factor DksA
VKKAPVKKAPVKKAPVKKAPVTQQPRGGTSTSTKVTPGSPASRKPQRDVAVAKPPASSNAAASKVAKKSPPSALRRGPEVFPIPAPRGRSKEGIAYTKDFDVKFLKAQWDLLLEERARLLGQAVRLEDEAHQLIEEAEMGDVQFDDEGGEGDTMVVERERDLALSAQARETITEIDAAIARISEGTYGYSTTSGRPIQRERLEAIPWATELVSEKVGGIGRR